MKGDGHAATRETRTEAGVAVRRRGEGPLPAVGGPAAASTESRVEAPQKAQNGHCVTQHSHFWAFTKNNTKQDLADTYTPVRGVTTAKRPGQPRCPWEDAGWAGSGAYCTARDPGGKRLQPGSSPPSYRAAGAPSCHSALT